MGELRLHIQYLTILDVLAFVIHHAKLSLFPIVRGKIIFQFSNNVTIEWRGWCSLLYTPGNSCWSEVLLLKE